MGVDLCSEPALLTLGDNLEDIRILNSGPDLGVCMELVLRSPFYMIIHRI